MNNDKKEKFEISQQRDAASKNSKRPPFAMVFPCEIMDSSISNGAFRLLCLLKFRAGKFSSAVVSYSTLAADMGCSVSTVNELAKQLRDVGLLKSESGGFNRCKKKTLTHPSEVYEYDVFNNPYSFMKHDRSKESLDKMRNVEAVKVDNSRLSSDPKNRITGQSRLSKVGPIENPDFRTVDIRKSGQVITRDISGFPDTKEIFSESLILDQDIDQDPRSESSIRVSSYDNSITVPETQTEAIASDQKHAVASPEPDQTGTGVPIPTPRISEPDFADDDRLAAARAALTPLSDNSAFVSRMREKSLNKRNAVTPVAAAEKRQAKLEAKQERQKNREPNSIDFERIWRENHKKKYPNTPLEPLSSREMGEARNMVSIYGIEAVAVAIEKIFNSWDEIRYNNLKWKTSLGEVPNFSCLQIADFRKTIMQEAAKRVAESAVAGDSTPVIPVKRKLGW